jgi:hypothetical protein
MGRKESHHVSGVIELLHNSSVPLLPILDASGAFAIR